MEELEYIAMDKLEKEHWWFVAKRNFLVEMLSRCGIVEGNVLDVGCGTGAVMQFLAQRKYQVEGVDMSDTALNFCVKKGLRVSKGVAEKLPYPDDSFDVVTALDVIEHVPDESPVINEIKRVLKPGGVCIATVPAHQFLWSYHDVQLHHYRRYRKDGFEKIFQNKLSIEYSSWIHCFILVPALIVRMFVKIKKIKKNESDIKDSNIFLNKIMKIFYFFELFIFRVFKRLPFGLSIIVVARKKI